MFRVNRRKFLVRSGAGVAATLASSSWPLRTLAQGGGRVLIIGGGFGGATCAKYLRRADPSIEVTLVEREPSYITGPMSNAVIGGLRSMGSITVSFDELASRHGVRVIQGNVVAIDTAAQSVALEEGNSLPYVRLVVAPGIDHDYSGFEGFTESVTSRMPHAWKPGSQTQLLRSQLEAMDNGGTVIISCTAKPLSLSARTLRTSQPYCSLPEASQTRFENSDPGCQGAFRQTGAVHAGLGHTVPGHDRMGTQYHGRSGEWC